MSSNEHIKHKKKKKKNVNQVKWDITCHLHVIIKIEKRVGAICEIGKTKKNAYTSFVIFGKILKK